MFKRKKINYKTVEEELIEEVEETNYIIEPSNIDLMNKLCRLEMLYFQMMTGIDNLNNELEHINQQIMNIENKSGNEEFNSYFS